MRKTSLIFKAALAVGFAVHLMAFNPGDWILLVAYVWGLGLGFLFFGPAFEELLAQIARIRTDPRRRSCSAPGAKPHTHPKD